MFRRFHEKLQEKEGGFTLIELLVVILIIAILAAIAIPVFLSQREKGWVSQAKSSLKNAATAQESYLVDNGAYTADVADLTGAANEGFTQTTDAPVTVEDAVAASSYCLQVDHANLTENYFYSSDSGTPAEGSCP